MSCLFTANVSHLHYSARLQWPEHQGDLAPVPYFECHMPFEAEAYRYHLAPTVQHSILTHVTM